MVDSLHGSRILITRQHDQSASLVAKIQALQGVAVSVPLFVVEPIALAVSMLRNKIQHSDLLIIVSKNAAELSLPMLTEQPHLRLACIGPATAKYLKEYGLDAFAPEHPPYNGVALVQALKSHGSQLCGANVLVLTGAQGNQDLQQQLLAIGAKVETIELYRRIMPYLAFAELDHIFNSGREVDIILITCVTSLQHWFEYTKGSMKLAVPLLVVSERIAKAALEMGFINVYTSGSIAENDILSSLIKWREAYDRRNQQQK